VESVIIRGSWLDFSQTVSDGYGASHGAGAGYGYGYGYGNLQIWQAQYRDIDPYPPHVTLALWKSNALGGSANGGESTSVATPGLIQEVKGPLELCSKRALHATLIPSAWEGERLWLVALYGEVQEQDGKLGALKREIIREIPLGNKQREG
jgi:hypothetical protein